MKRLFRYTLNGLTLLSLLLFVAVVVLWARSYRAVEGVEWQGVGQRRGGGWVNRDVRAISSAGGVMLVSAWRSQDDPGGVPLGWAGKPGFTLVRGTDPTPEYPWIPHNWSLVRYKAWRRAGSWRPPPWERLGLQFERQAFSNDRGYRDRRIVVVAPHWFLETVSIA